jgi:membrane associated rhomboid family serine protease
VSASSPSGPEFEAPGFTACYRHPDRQTGIRCQRCRKPICGECMRPASVGFQCPQCVSAGRSSARPTKTLFGAALKPGGGTATKVLMGVLGAVYVLDLISRGLLSLLLVMSNQAVAAGQFWRLVTASLTGGTLLGVLLNLLVLWLVGRAIESEAGGWRFVCLYLTAGLGGATLCFVLGPPGLVAVGSAWGIIGLLAANAIGKLKTHEDIRGDISLLVLIILYSLLIGFNSFGWLGMIGGALVGGLSGAILAYAPRQSRTAFQVFGLLAVVLVCLVAVVSKIALG